MVVSIENTGVKGLYKDVKRIRWLWHNVNWKSSLHFKSIWLKKTAFYYSDKEYGSYEWRSYFLIWISQICPWNRFYVDNDIIETLAHPAEPCFHLLSACFCVIRIKIAVHYCQLRRSMRWRYHFLSFSSGSTPGSVTPVHA